MNATKETAKKVDVLMTAGVTALSLIDFYKSGHIRHYPHNTEEVYSNLTPRTGAHSNVPDSDGIIWAGISGVAQWLLVELWNKTFFERPVEEVVAEYQIILDTCIAANMVSMDHIVALHELGYLPVEIKSLPEGSFVPYGVPTLTIRSNNSDFGWITNYLETQLSAETWKCPTSATMAFAYRKRFEEHAAKTGYDASFVMWQGHDFSYRGMGGHMDAIMSDFGHIGSFYGTDTLPVIPYAMRYYHANIAREVIAGSIAATEHSVQCLHFDEFDGDELAYLDHMLEMHPAGPFSIVCDGFDFFDFITNTLPKRKDIIMSREGRIVIRPDSGEPADIICGTNPSAKELTKDELNDLIVGPDSEGEIINYEGVYYLICGIQEQIEDYGIDSYQPDVDNLSELVMGGKYSILQPVEAEDTNEGKGAYQILMDEFGFTVNDKGYRELDTHVGLIYGDSITLARQDNILNRLEARGDSGSNLVLGIGSFTYTFVTRDTHGFAMKATYGRVDGKAKRIWKDPKTGGGFKKSAKGLLRVDKVNGDYKLTDDVTPEEEAGGCLELIFKDSQMVKTITLAEYRANIDAELKRVLA